MKGESHGLVGMSEDEAWSFQDCAAAIQASQNDETSPSRSVLNCWRPRGVPILNNERMITLRLCAAADSKYRFRTFSIPVSQVLLAPPVSHT